ncbi:fungal-specific transcription factor domain-containing protein [Auriculariales sp. MPI-PUGE-AT-0066]|nr:fungal-specific transcription factor domain-containing protein [Auriculariales sp. MPI-PUGE-AT-0066]
MSAVRGVRLDTSRPCDSCRRGKRRCDGPQQADRACTRCKRLHKPCSYTDYISRGPSVPKAYITALESRLAVVEGLLQQHVPEALLMREMGALAMNQAASTDILASNDHDAPASSSLAAAEHLDDAIALSRQSHGIGLRDSDGAANMAPTVRKRPEFWAVPTCEFRGERLEDRDFDPMLPPPGQMAPLVRAYFETWNLIHPVFHRPLFEQQLLAIHETRDKHFMAALLLVCALGEGRLALEKQGSAEEQSAGWEYFMQAEPFLRIPTPTEPQLLDVQIYYLAAGFMALNRGNSAFWILHGTAVELAFQAHAHRRSRYRRKEPNLHDELWKRTFWSLVVGDRIAAYIYGRPTIIKDESFDLDLPLEVDDSRWDITSPGYPLREVQVSEHGSCSFFVWNIRLALILGISLQTLYSNNRSRILMGFIGADWEQQITNRLDELLNDWVTNVPSYLRWDPDITNLGQFVESSLLNAKYYCLRIMAHNPFMRTTARDFSAPSRSAAGFNPQVSLEICTKAALECSALMMVVLERYPRCLAIPGWIDPPFACGLVLLVILFGFTAHLPDVEVTRYTTYVRVCLDILQIVSAGYETAMQRGETLRQLASGLEHKLPPSVYMISTPPMFRPRSQQSERWPENPTVPWSPGIPPGLSPHPAPSSRVPTTLRDHFNISKLPTGLTEQMSTGLKHPVPLYPVLDARDTRASALATA